MSGSDTENVGQVSQVDGTTEKIQEPVTLDKQPLGPERASTNADEIAAMQATALIAEETIEDETSEDG